MKYIQIFDVDRNSKSMFQDWMRYKQGEPGYRVLMSSTPYNWLKVFNAPMAWNAGLPIIELDDGTHRDIRDDDYLLHVHVNGENSGLINKIKTASPNTRVLASIDYGLNLWGRIMVGFGSVQEVISNIQKADFIFSTEPEIAAILAESLGRDVPCIPHPVDVAATSKYQQEHWEEPKTCTIMTHMLDPDYYLPHLVLRDLPIRTHIVGIDHKTMRQIYDRVNGILYNRLSEYTSFEYLIDPTMKTTNTNVGAAGFLSKSFIGFDSYSFKVTGRVQTDLACLGIPCLGCDLQHFQKVLFPETTAGYYEISKMRNIAKKLLSDKDFYNEVSLTAQRNILEFDLEPTKQKMLEFLGEVDDAGKEN